MKRYLILFVLIFTLSSFAAADALTGKVTNGTNGKASAGDEVVLLKLAGGMEEESRTRTDSKGQFTFKTDTSQPHLIRVEHAKVNYHRSAPPGTSSVEIEVYDAAQKVDGVSATVDIIRVQTENGQMQVAEMYAVKNDSKPPRTQMNADGSFDFYVPVDAQVDSAVASSGGSNMPVNASAVPRKEKGRYTFIFPLRPGETRFQISYSLPYSRSADFKPKLLYPVEHLVVMLPKSMKFKPTGAAKFDESNEDPTMNILVTPQVKPGAELAFQVSGTGVIPREEQQTAGAQAGGQPAQPRDSRPGGGLGAPIEAPDALQQYRWYILGGLLALLGVGAFFLMGKPALAMATAAPGSAPRDFRVVVTKPEDKKAKIEQAAAILEAMKEELFQLEADRLQGKISNEEYARVKAALEVTLQRALTRGKA